jgi:hypothetical protein
MTIPPLLNEAGCVSKTQSHYASSHPPAHSSTHPSSKNNARHNIHAVHADHCSDRRPACRLAYRLECSASRSRPATHAILHTSPLIGPGPRTVASSRHTRILCPQPSTSGTRAQSNSSRPETQFAVPTDAYDKHVTPAATQQRQAIKQRGNAFQAEAQ